MDKKTHCPVGRARAVLSSTTNPEARGRRRALAADREIVPKMRKSSPNCSVAAARKTVRHISKFGLTSRLTSIEVSMIQYPSNPENTELTRE